MQLKPVTVFLFSLSIFWGLPANGIPINPLPSWADLKAKSNIIDFVEQTVQNKPISERIAVFDLDGTLIIEKPYPMEMYLDVQRLCYLHKKNPNTYNSTIFIMACLGNFTWLNQHSDDVRLTAYNGTTQRFFNTDSGHFSMTQANPLYAAPLIKLFYQPMLELVRYLVKNNFVVYVVSGSEQGFIRALLKKRDEEAPAEQQLNITEEHVISEAVLLCEDDQNEFIREYAFRTPNNWKQGKAINLRMILGDQPPIFAFGNTMGDFYMLSYATTPTSNNDLALVLNHDDPDRECFYEDKKLLANAEKYGWTIVSMKKDFLQLFPTGVPPRKKRCDEFKKK